MQTGSNSMHTLINLHGMALSHLLQVLQSLFGPVTQQVQEVGVPQHIPAMLFNNLYIEQVGWQNIPAMPCCMFGPSIVTGALVE